jgi:phosphatidylglycerol:prolipoprotein diacylglycerol transferase
MEITIKHSHVPVLKKAFEVSLYVVIFAVSVPAFFFLLGHSLDRITNPFSQTIISLEMVGTLLIGLGGSIAITAIFDLNKFGRGLPASPVPPTTLVMDGVYRLSRHPIYFGSSLSFLGSSLFLHSFWSCVLSWPLFTFFFFGYAQRVEEPVLERRFGEEYSLYKESVPMFWDFPFRKALLDLVPRFFSWISDVVNKPFILRYRHHLFFLGYGLWVGLGVFVGLMVLNTAFVAENISSSTTAWMIFFFTVASLAGSRLVSMIVVMSLQKKTLKQAWYRVGFVSWGALLAAILSGGLFYILSKKSLCLWFDAAFTGLMLNHFFGRIGCLFFGCCYGKETRSPFHVHYTHPSMKAVRENLVKTKTLYPTQIYSALYGLLIFTVVFTLWSTTSIRVGFPTAICLILYGFFRFIEEWYRYQKRTVAGIFSPAQLVCMVLVLFGVLHLGCILDASNPSFYQPLARFSLGEIFSQLHILLALGMGLLTAFVFSYHRHEIGSWGRSGMTRKQEQGG